MGPAVEVKLAELMNKEHASRTSVFFAISECSSSFYGTLLRLDCQGNIKDVLA